MGWLLIMIKKRKKFEFYLSNACSYKIITKIMQLFNVKKFVVIFQITDFKNIEILKKHKLLYKYKKNTKNYDIMLYINAVQLNNLFDLNKDMNMFVYAISKKKLNFEDLQFNIFNSNRKVISNYSLDIEIINEEKKVYISWDSNLNILEDEIMRIFIN